MVIPGEFVPGALPAASPTNGPYDFLFDRGQFFGTGQRANPTIKAAWAVCQPIRYALNVDEAEDNLHIQVMIDSIEEMEAAIGIDFQFAGVTSAGMNVADALLRYPTQRCEAPQVVERRERPDEGWSLDEGADPVGEPFRVFDRRTENGAGSVTGSDQAEQHSDGGRLA